MANGRQENMCKLLIRKIKRDISAIDLLSKTEKTYGDYPHLQRLGSGKMSRRKPVQVDRRIQVLVNAMTRKPVPVKCKSAGTCRKTECILKYSWTLDKCEGYLRREIELKLINLKLTFFKGCRQLEINANGKNVNIYGDNETGKTTIFDAITWLLFDKDSLNVKDFGIKTLENGKVIPGIDHEVEAMFDVNGMNQAFKKVYKEVYTKKRGSATEEFTGHTTDYFVNEVPVKKSEYEAKIKAIAPEDLFRLMTNPLYFNENMHWQERRKILFELCNDVGNDEIFAQNKDLAALSEILKSRSIEEHKKVIAAKKKKIADEQERISVRIDETKKGQPIIAGLDFADIEKKISQLREQSEKLYEKLQGVKSGNGVAEKQKQLLEIDAEIMKFENELQNKRNEAIGEYQTKLIDAKVKSSELNSVIAWNVKNIEFNKKQIEKKEKQAEELRAKWREVNALTFTGDTVCPTCRQELPESIIEQSRDRFNNDKAEGIISINTEGKGLKEEIEKDKEELQKLEDETNKLIHQLDDVLGNIKDLEHSIEGAKATLKSYDDTELYEKKRLIALEIEDLKRDSTKEVLELNSSIKSIQSQIQALQTDLAKKEQFEKDEARVKELREQQQKLSREYDELEQELNLTEEFIRTKARILEEKINERFEFSRFKLFNEQINGGLDECCITTYKGVPYPDLNKAARTNVGLEIISVLSKHYGFSAPIIVDNAESVTSLYKTESQMIRLVVSEQDKKLRVEVEE